MPKSGRFEFGRCFQDLRFDLSEGESKEVAAAAHKMAKEDIRSFCYLSNYLLMSCKKMEQKGLPLAEITKQYQLILEILHGIYRPAPEIAAENKQFELHKSFKKEELMPKLEVWLEGAEDPQETLDNFIMKRADESLVHLKRFTSLMKEICLDNGGFRFKSGVKI